MTVVEMMVASTLGVIVLLVVYVLTVFGFRSFAALGNYAELDGNSRAALDRMGREIRQATHVTSAQTNGIVKWLTVVNRDLSPAVTNTFTWYSNTALLMWDRWEGSTHTVRTNLTGCDQWDFKMYIRAPNSNGAFVPTGNIDSCKLINMSWRCSRKILGKKLNTETVLTAEVVLRNKRATLP
jgi:Tfp pilus assembly protein PilW